MADKMTDIIIIGGGTAGMTAAVYAGRAGRSVKVLEQSIHGGQIINTSHVENFPGFDNIAGFEFATALYDQAVKFGAEFVYEKVTGIENADGFKRVLTANGHYDAKAVIIATGARPRPIGVAGEEKFVGRGISFCATCDGAFYKGKTVAVIQPPSAAPPALTLESWVGSGKGTVTFGPGYDPSAPAFDPEDWES